MWRRSEGSCAASTMSTCHSFTPPSPHYPYPGQLGQQCNSVRMYPYAYPQRMNMLKHFLYIQYGCGEEVRGVVQPQPCQHIILSPHHPQSPDYPNLLGQLGQQCNSVRMYPYAYPQHMNRLIHFLYIQYGCGEKVRGVVQPQPCQHIITSSHHPQITHICWVNLASSVTV